MDLSPAASSAPESLDGRPRRADGGFPGAERSGDARQSIRMTADRILVLASPEAGERRSRAGIVIPATANVDRRLVWGEVVALGPAVRSVDAGDRVLFVPDSGHEVEIRGDEYLILRERDVHAVASKRSDGQTGLYL